MGEDHEERLERFREQAERVRAKEVEDIAADVLGLDRDEVSRALRGNVTREEDEE